MRTNWRRWEFLVLAGTVLLCVQPVSAGAQALKPCEGPSAATLDGRLFCAISTGTPDEVRALIAEGANVNARDRWDFTPVMAAAFEGRSEVLRVLLKAGADPHLGNDRLGNAMVAAGSGGNPEVVEILLAEGLDINSAGKDHHTAVSWAAMKGHANLIPVLAAAGADMNVIAGQSECPPLVDAIRRSDAATIRALLDSGADPNPQAGYTSSSASIPLTSAVGTRQPDIVRLILDAGATANLKDNVAQWALQSAAFLQSDEILALLLERASRFEDFADGQVGALHSALYVNEYFGQKGFRALIRAGININVRSKTGDTALHAAVRQGREDNIGMVLELGGDVNAMNDRGETPLSLVNNLHYRHQPNRIEVAKMLLEAGAEVHSLPQAVREKDVELVRMFLAAGAYTNPRNTYGPSAFFDAVYTGNPEIVQLFLDAGAGANIKARNRAGRTPLMAVAPEEAPEVTRLLLDVGADPNLVDAAGRNALMLALLEPAEDDWGDPLRFEPFETAMVLIEGGTDLTTVDRSGETALDIARRRGLDKVAEALTAAMGEARHSAVPDEPPIIALVHSGSVAETRKAIDRGADVSVSTIDGTTPLHLAVESGNLEMSQMLLAAGARIGARNGAGMDALLLACRAKDAAMVKLLLKAGAQVRGRGWILLKYALSWKDPESAEPEQDKSAEPDPEEQARAMAAMTETALTLIEAGGDQGLGSVRDALPYAIGSRNDDVGVVLADAGPPYSYPEGGPNYFEQATLAGMTKTVMRMVESLKEIDPSGGYVRMGLMNSAKSGNVELFEFFLGMTPDDETTAEVRNLALGFAAEGGHLELLRRLLESGADVEGGERTTDNRWTPLARVMGSDNPNPEIIGVLLKAGANPNVETRQGWRSLDVAIWTGDPEIVRMFLDAGTLIPPEAFSRAATTGDLQIFRMLYDHGPKPDMRSTIGPAILGAAAMSGHGPLTRYILTLGVDINGSTSYGETALTEAARVGQAETVRILLQNGAKVDVRGKEDRTALINAVVANSSVGPDRRIPTVKILLEAGADPRVEDMHGYSALAYAESGLRFEKSHNEQRGFAEILKILKEAASKMPKRWF